MKNFNSEDALLLEATELLLSLIHSLTHQDLSGFFYTHLDQYIQLYNLLLTAVGAEKVKIRIFMLLRQLIIRFTYEMNQWGTQEENQRTPEEIETFQALRIQMIELTLNAITTCQDESAISAAFAALSSVASQKQLRDFFLDGDRLRFLCENVLIPCVSLKQEELEDFTPSPLEYFKKDIQGYESESLRKCAYDFLRSLCRQFRSQLAQTFSQYATTLLQQFTLNHENWVQLDTAYFITGVIAAENISFRDGVSKVDSEFNLDEFIQLFVIPILCENLPQVLQCDAIKFYVDFRNCISRNLTAQNFPLFISLIQKDHPVSLYVVYLLNLLLNSNKLQLDAEFLVHFDMNQFAINLFALTYFQTKENQNACECLATVCSKAVNLISPATYKTLIEKIMALLHQVTNRSEPSFFHSLFNFIAAALTLEGIPVAEVEAGIHFELDRLISENIYDFIPYAYQILGACLYAQGDEINPCTLR